MHKKTVLTLSTVEGTRSMSMSKVLFPIVGAGCFILAVGFIGGWLYSHYLTALKNEISDQKDLIEEKYVAALSYSSSLSEELSILSQDIVAQADMLQKVDVIEKILKQKKSNDIFTSPSLVTFDNHQRNQDVLKRINNQLNRKIRILYALPSGTPLKEDTYISSSYGRRSHPIHNRIHLHSGIDMPLQIGDEVISTADGTAIFTGRRAGYGNTVIISHSYGFTTYYGHLDKIRIKVGEIVTKGETIAEGGNTGISTGPHLHYEIRYMGETVNPYHFYTWNLMNFENIFKKGRNINWQEITTAIDHSYQIQALQLSRVGPN